MPQNKASGVSFLIMCFFFITTLAFCVACLAKLVEYVLPIFNLFLGGKGFLEACIGISVCLYVCGMAWHGLMMRADLSFLAVDVLCIDTSLNSTMA